jgi:hypothetical protein
MALIAVDHARDRKPIYSELLLSFEMIPPLRGVEDLSLRTGNCGVPPPKPRKKLCHDAKDGKRQSYLLFGTHHFLEKPYWNATQKWALS